MKEKEAKENQGVRDAGPFFPAPAGAVRDAGPFFSTLDRRLDALSFLNGLIRSVIEAKEYKDTTQKVGEGVNGAKNRPISSIYHL